MCLGKLRLFCLRNIWNQRNLAPEGDRHEMKHLNCGSPRDLVFGYSQQYMQKCIISLFPQLTCFLISNWSLILTTTHYLNFSSPYLPSRLKSQETNSAHLPDPKLAYILHSDTSERLTTSKLKIKFHFQILTNSFKTKF